MATKKNKGEWSELYAFIKLLKEGKIYAADENVKKIDNVYFPIIKIVRSDDDDEDIDYNTGETVRIFKNGKFLGEISNEALKDNSELLFNRIFEGSESGKSAFAIPEIESLLDEMSIKQIKASSSEKVDIRMQIHDVHTGFNSLAGFSIKSDVGSPPTLLNAGKNTRFRYEVLGIDDEEMNRINGITKDTDSEYMKKRFYELFQTASDVKFHCMLSEKYEDNLMMIDSMLPEIYAYFILYHFATMDQSGIDCKTLCSILDEKNPLGYRKQNIYTYKIKKLLSASALGMTPGKDWDGIEAATGGYIIVTKEGDVLCYHIYNRNFFEEYLLNNTTIDRPSASRYDYAYVFKENGEYFIDLNIQIRFKSISAASRELDVPRETMDRLMEYIKRIQHIR